MPAQPINEFALWQPGYGGKTVTIYLASTTTLASVWKDEALSIAADNPQVLTSDANGAGRFEVPIYTSQPYYLDIEGEQTGIQRPAITSLAASDVSAATVTVSGSATARRLDDIVAAEIAFLNYGAISATPATNNATLEQAIGAASAAGGGTVLLPAGSIEITGVTLPTGVVLRGKHKTATTLVCKTGGPAITIGGASAGLRDLTLDGVIVPANSDGIYALNKQDVILEDVVIKRFADGIHAKGGGSFAWWNVDVEDCTNNVKIHGDMDASNAGLGGAFAGLVWIGGSVKRATGIGIDISYEDAAASHVSLKAVDFTDQTGTAIRLNGARHVEIAAFRMTGNTVVLEILDDTDSSLAARQHNTVRVVTFRGGLIDTGDMTLKDSCETVQFIGVEINDVDVTLTSVTHNIVLDGCIEDAEVTLSGDAVRWTRRVPTDEGSVSGLTTDANATKAWSMPLDHGQIAWIEARVMAKRQNGNEEAVYWLGQAFQRPAATLAYDSQTVNFTVGQIVTGITSGASGRIVADSDSGTTGTLSLKDVDGTFVDNETITDPLGGNALVNGALTPQNVAAMGSVTAICAAVEDDAAWNAALAANGPEVEVQVTGAAAKTIEWTVHVKVAKT